MAITYDRGADQLSMDYSTNYAMIEKISKQVIMGVQSTNKMQWIDKGKVVHGVAIEQAMVELAEGYDWKAETQDGSNLNKPSYPKIVLKYFAEWNGRQFKTTVSDTQIQKIILAGGRDADLAQKVVSSLTEGEGDEDYKYSKGLLLDGIQGKNIIPYGTADSDGTITPTVVPVSADLITTIKDISDDFGFVNTNYVAANYRTRTPFDRLHLIMPFKVYNKLNVDVLASLYNLEKAELLKKITLIDEGSKVFIVDEFGLVKHTRLYKMTSKYVEDGLYSNYWLTVDRMYGTSGLFKMAYIETSADGNTTKL